MLYHRMPKKPIDFSKTRMYKIVCKDLKVKDTYVGHTTGFSDRTKNHKSDCNNPNSHNYHLKVYKTIRDNGGWENWDMIEIEKYPCKDSQEAAARERYWYEFLNANLNNNVPNRTDNESKKNYRDNNKNSINAPCECDCGGKYSHKHKSTHLKTTKHRNYINSLKI